MSVRTNPESRTMLDCSPNQPLEPTLAGVMSTSDFMKQFSMFATLAAASGGSAPSR
jgi:hypothetical protein